MICLLVRVCSLFHFVNLFSQSAILNEMKWMWALFLLFASRSFSFCLSVFVIGWQKSERELQVSSLCLLFFLLWMADGSCAFNRIQLILSFLHRLCTFFFCYSSVAWRFFLYKFKLSWKLSWFEFFGGKFLSFVYRKKRACSFNTVNIISDTRINEIKLQL